MRGIQFQRDSSRKAQAVIIDLEIYGHIWEDFYDQLLAEQRENEPLESLEKVKKRLADLGKLKMDG